MVKLLFVILFQEKKNGTQKKWPYPSLKFSADLSLKFSADLSLKFSADLFLYPCNFALSFEVSTRFLASALELLAASPYCLSIEKVFLIEGGQIFRETLNAPGCDAIHITEIKSNMECGTFSPAIDSTVFQPWYSSFPKVKTSICHSFTTYFRVRSSEVESLCENNDLNCTGRSDSITCEVKEFSCLPKMIFEKHEECMYLKLVQEILSVTDGTYTDDRTGTDTLSKFGCQMRFNLHRTFPHVTKKAQKLEVQVDVEFNTIEELLVGYTSSFVSKVINWESFSWWF